jgi:phytanoyl-CoA hydroxylase
MTLSSDPKMDPARLLEQDYRLKPEQIDSYRLNGFVVVEDVICGHALQELRDAVERAVAAESTSHRSGEGKAAVYEQIFIQRVNLWQRHPEVSKYVLSPRLGNLAARLAGVPLRVWHDQALFKEPRTGSKTPWHQDAHYWPHVQKDHPITIWIALRDATIINGCMSFIPQSQSIKTLEPVDLADPQDLLDLAPQFRGVKPQVCELKAGSCTFHHGLTFHYAGPNRSDGMREAFAIIYMADGTSYSGKDHVVTDPLRPGLKAGDVLDHPLFPLVGWPEAT